ncbi:chromatin assembly factor 1 subunit FAS1-like [Impatiens glandulifera]|uniref:chromatin assembly factor 1 subunit FAS1-like n=1 Tax=Impatiens glandulifera TaxID=253017 RepID=UPI001FB15B32|nr:chromatin assembly factor 1 subunit FAS1-like [Impatiens glandulifera]
MAEPPIEVGWKSEEPKSGGGVEMQNSKIVKKPVKRKRVSEVGLLKSEERYYKVDDLRQELEGLFRYHRELVDNKMDFDIRGCASTNSAVACLLEESRLPFSKLVSEIYEKMKEREDGSENGVTLAFVKSSVHFVGQRFSYGLTNLDADLFEDETDSYFWFWETRDMKLLPSSSRGMIKIRRTCRKKISERIAAVSDMITALQKSEALQSCGQELKKASERLCKVLNEADIRLLVQTLVEKNSADMTDTKVKKEEKKLIKEMEKSKREEEKEKKRKNQELLKSEKELKRLQSEAANEERKRRREEAEHRKQLKRKQGDIEKDQRRREKEEAENKKQIDLQKQASLMDRFLKRSKNNSTCLNSQSSSRTIASDSSPNKESVTFVMDSILLRKDEMNVEDILKGHCLAWRSFGRTNCPNRKKHWGVRLKPKSEVIKEIKLSTGKALVGEDELNMEKLDGVWDKTNSDGRSDNTMSDSSGPLRQKPNRRKQLLQFDKSNRPAFYGIWTKKSQDIGPCRPFKKDPDMDYEIDSEEEWEEEEPGENLSDSDKDDEDEIIEEGSSKADCEDNSEDGFLVPDGYLSENEGIQISEMESDCKMNEAGGLPRGKMDPEKEQKMHLFLRQQKHMQKLTDHALRRNQPFIISNLKHEKASIMMAEGLIGTSKLEQLCLRALSIYQFPGGLCISAVDDELEKDDEIFRLSMNNESSTSSPKMSALSELELREIVSTIQSCQHGTVGMNRVLESLQPKFPSTPKSQLKTKVREISDYVGNRWQVKRDVLDKLGFSSSPGSSSVETKNIDSFFPKMNLPPDENDNNSPSKLI